MVTGHRRETLELEEQKFSKVTLASAAREGCQHLRVKLDRELLEEEVEMSRKVSNHLRFKIELEQREFANVTLASEDVNVRGAHKVMLAGASPLEKAIAKQVAKYLTQNLEKFTHEGAQIPTLWMCPIGEVEKDLTLAPRRDTQEEKIGVKEVWVSKCKHTEKATIKIVEERQHTSSVRASEIIVIEGESGQYISDGSPRKEVSPVLREENFHP